MKAPTRWTRPAAALSLLLAAASPVSGIVATAAAAAPEFKCSELLVGDHKFDFSALAGPHTVVTTEFAPPSYYNRTYTVDLCGPLKRKGEVKKEYACPEGTRVCAIKHKWDPETKKSAVVEEVIPIAGDLEEHGGKAFSWEAERVVAAAPEDEDNKTNVRLTLKGGRFEHRAQEAVIELRCSKTMKGGEKEWESEDEYEKPKAKREEEKKKEGEKEGEDGTPEKQLAKEGAALVWNGYKRSADGEKDTLYLTWHTEHACLKAADEKPSAGSAGWGFFTWLIVLAFLIIASYLIFGSWLNYNRYGARGWDLLPHGDTLRDIPYLLKDWTRRVLNTVQSSGSRGGYSAV